MHEGHWPKRGLTRVAKIGKPGSSLAERQRVLSRHLHEEIVRMLSIDERLAFVSLASLKKQRRTTARKRKRLSTEHSAQL